MGFFIKKNIPNFFCPPHPPAFPPEPLKGGLCHAPRKSGPPQKRGRGSGGNFGEKTRQNPAKIGLKWGFLGGFGGQKWHFFKIFEKNGFFAGAYARRKTLHGGGCPLCKNPPIYTVLNAAFSAPHPPLRGYQCTRVPSRGVFGGPPQNPLPSRRPPCRPRRLLHVALAESMTLNLSIILKVIVINIWHKHADCLDRKSTYI